MNTFICVLSVAAFVLAIVAMRGLLQGPLVLSEREAAAIHKIGYTPTYHNDYGNWSPRQRILRRRFSAKHLDMVGESNSYVVNSYGCTAGGTLIWGGDGFRFHVAFHDGTVAEVPVNYFEEYGESQTDGISLRTFFAGLPKDRLQNVSHIILEKWRESEDSPGCVGTYVKLIILSGFEDQVSNLSTLSYAA